MKKFIVFVLLVIFSFVGFSQYSTPYFQTFGWSDDNLSLYYATDTTNYWSRSYSNSTRHYYFQDPYSNGISDTNVCFMVFPKRWHYQSCCNSGVVFGDNAFPYKNVKTGSSACSPLYLNYTKPKGVLNIPYYNIRLENSIPQYRNVVGISERTFYGCDSLVKITIPSTVREIGRMFVYGCDMLDTVVFENTFNEDTIYPPTMNDYTWFITHPITIVVPCNSYDTFYNYIYSLNTPQIVQLNIVPDELCNCNAYTIDTVAFYDTVKVYDTTYTTITYYDTVDVNVYHTHHIYDTTFVVDTIIHNVWNIYYDTTVVNVYDTIIVSVYDTIIDTITYIHEIYDTIYNTITDTIIVTLYDTIYETVYDTIYVFLETQETFNDLKLYPIPTKDYVTVEYNGYLDYRLYNTNGKLLETGSVVLTDQIDLTKYASGVYYFNAKLDDGTIVTKKLVKVAL